MIAGARYGHTNLIANDWRALSKFYSRAVRCHAGARRSGTFKGPDSNSGPGFRRRAARRASAPTRVHGDRGTRRSDSRLPRWSRARLELDGYSDDSCRPPRPSKSNTLAQRSAWLDSTRSRTFIRCPPGFEGWTRWKISGSGPVARLSAPGFAREPGAVPRLHLRLRPDAMAEAPGRGRAGNATSASYTKARARLSRPAPPWASR